jgi:hypothetical protein
VTGGESELADEAYVAAVDVILEIGVGEDDILRAAIMGGSKISWR